jgi:hypothetical protein
MDTLSIIITLVSVIASVLQIVLFFKVWGMCNDVRAMRRGNTTNTQEAETNIPDSKFVAKGWGSLILAFSLITLIVVFIIYNN